MKESTKKTLDEAHKLVEAAGMKMDEDGFKYHSKRTWIGFTTCTKVVTVACTSEEPTIVLYVHSGLDVYSPEDDKPKKKPKVKT